MTPRLSFVLPSEHAATTTAVLAAATANAIWSETEVVVVCGTRERLALTEADVPGGAALRIVELARIDSMAQARAAGVRAATAPLVFLAETHGFPQPGCLDALVAALAEPRYGVAVPAFESANPERPGSWAALALSYLYMLEPHDDRDTRIPCYNCCFRREALIAFGDQLPEALAVGTRMRTLLAEHGYAAHREPSARLRHLNVARVRSLALDRLYASRTWAAARGERWGRGKRLLALAATPLVPPLLVLRTVRSPQWRRVRPELPRWTVAALWWAACWSAAGVALAGLSGAGSAPERLVAIELDRWDHV
jgi:hypothetical protein